LKVIGSTCFVKGYPELQSKAKLTERYGASGRELNAQELEKLINNTEQLVAELTREYEEHIKAEELRLVKAEQQRMEQEQQRINVAALLEEQRRNAELKAQAEAERCRKEFDEKVAKRTAELVAQAERSGFANRYRDPLQWEQVKPSQWVNDKKSALVLILRDGSAWIRCEDVSGKQRLYPVNPKDDWTQLLPTRCGNADLASASFIVKSASDALFILRNRGIRFEQVCSSFNEAMGVVKLRF
ncbi:MAG: hypothetical protein RSA54_11800, partial [Glutamicibacter sp.]